MYHQKGPVIGPDIYWPLLHSVLSDGPFEIWHNEETPWQLRVVGAPGSGKSTLAAAMVQELKKVYHGPKDAVASIFVAPDVRWDEAALESVLLSILDQITKTCEKPSSEAKNLPWHTIALKPDDDDDDDDDDDITQPRIEKIRRAIRKGIRSLDRAFLVVDGVDDCGWFTESCIEKDLAQLQQVGLKVVLSSRTLALTDDELNQVCATCDICEGGPKRNLRVFWKCGSNYHKDSFIVCSTCRKSFGKCPECGTEGPLVQPYDRVIIDMNEAFPDGMMGEFVAWDLEREHGNLGLASNNSNKPPLSSIGAALLASASDTILPTPAQKMHQKIVMKAQGNMALARLRLDILHESAPETVEAGDRLSDLPADVIAFFSTGIRMMEAQQQQGVSNMGSVGVRILVLTLAILGDCPVETVAGLLEKAGYPIGSSSLSPLCITQRVLHATRGFLLLRPSNKDLYRYNETFQTFVYDGDCEAVRRVCVAMLKELDGTARSESEFLLLKDFDSLKERILDKIQEQLE